MSDQREKNRVALVSVGAAVFLTGTKLVVGLLTGSLGILSEAAHSGLDLLAAMMTWFSVRVSDRPADGDHPYGHHKVDNLSALVETLLLLVTCLWIFYEAVERLFFRAPVVEVNAWSYGVLVLAIVIDFTRSRALIRVARRTRSAALEADALHFSSDIASSAVVLVGLVLTQAGYPQADAVGAIAVGLLVVWISVRLGKKAVDALIDRVPPDHRPRAERVALAVPGVRRAYDVRVREAGPKHFIDLKVAVDPALNLEAVHALTDTVEDALRRDFEDADVLVHAEPDGGHPEGLGETVERLAGAVGARMHDLRIQRTSQGLDVAVHLEWPPGKSLAEAHRCGTEVEERARRLFPGIRAFRTHLESFDRAASDRRDVTADNASLVARIREAAAEEGASCCSEVTILEGEDRLWVALSCELDASLSLEEAHARATRIELRVRRLAEKIASVVVHTEPATACSGPARPRRW
ncbi:MAG: cation diffusion facilitator family transporter [Deltaproteobacteria bacterium]|nr:cation diffusion facilitator family transporter [Deltaproteobacteria bacterium]